MSELPEWRSDSHETVPGGPRQFSLGAMFLAVLAVAVSLSVERAWPGSVFLASLALGWATVVMSLAACLAMPLWWEPGASSSLPGKAFSAWRRAWRVPWGGDPGATETWRIAALAMLTSLVAVVGWPVIRGFAQAATALWLESRDAGWLESWFDRLRWAWFDLGDSFLWSRLVPYEAWSIARWWLLFGALTGLLAIVRRLPVSGAARRPETGSTLGRDFLGFAPWFVLLETSFLCLVWLAEFSMVVPEPGTFFFSSGKAGFWTRWLENDWLARGAAPSFLVGLLYFRRVWHATWPVAVGLALGLAPVALFLSYVWSVKYAQWWL